MHKSKLILLLKTFSGEENIRFHDFLSSIYFNKNKTLIKFFEILRKEYPHFDSDKILKKNVYLKLFPENEFNEQVLKNLISDLLKLCREFLEIEIYEKDKNEKQLNLLKQLTGRNADPVYFTELKNFEKQLNELSELSEKSFYYLYQLEELKISFHLERNEQPKVIEKVMKSGEFLLLYFHLHLTKIISNLNVNKHTYKVDYKTNLPGEFFDNINFEKVIKYMKEKDISYSEIVEMYYLRVICNSQQFNEKNYFKFKELVIKNLNLLDRVETYGLFNALETFNMKYYSTSNEFFMNELLDIYKTEIENGFYKFSDTSPVTLMKFRNTFNSAVRSGEFEWAENFLDDFQNDVIESDRNNLIKISHAQINFETGDFEKSLELISEINPDHLYLKIDIRNLTLMSYYELNYLDSAISAIDSFKHFISSNKSLSDHFKESNIRFANSLNSLILFKEKDQKEKLADLKIDLIPFKGERRINWLMEKIDEVI